MKNIFKNKKIWQKILIVFLIIILFKAIVSKPVHAEDKETSEADILLKPITGLFVGLADALEGVAQKTVLGVDESIIKAKAEDANFWATFLVIGAFVVGTAIAIAAAIPSGGTSIGVWGAVVLGTTIAAKIAISLGTFIIFGNSIINVVSQMIGTEMDLPQFALSPYEIFADKITVLDVNFFDPKPNEKITELEQKGSGSNIYLSDYLNSAFGESSRDDSTTMYMNDFNRFKADYGLDYTRVMSKESSDNGSTTIYRWENNGKYYEAKIDNKEFETSPDSKVVNGNRPTGVPYSYNETHAIKVHYIKEISYEEKVKSVLKSPANELRTYIAGWYTTLRNLALVMLLSVLVYIGIRIMLSSVASDKAKYKQMLVDWAVAISLLFVMHYIMSFSIHIVGKFNDMVASIKIEDKEKDEIKAKLSSQDYGVSDDIGNAVKIYVFDGTSSNSEDLKKTLHSAYEVMKDQKLKDLFYKNNKFEKREDKADSKDNANVLVWPASNFMEQARIEYQLLRKDGTDNRSMYGYGLIYVVLVIYTIIFLFTYMKRVVYMAFLTVIAPLVAVTYPIDKMNDGKAQAFDMWFKEYIFNLLIQPLHLLLYSVLIGSAMSFASDNLIYVVMALAFFVPAEKILRRFFGFEKAQTPGMFGGPAGSALMFSGLQRLMHPRPPKGLGVGNNGKGNLNENETDSKKEIPQSNKMDEIEGFMGRQGEENDNNPINGEMPDRFAFDVNDENDPRTQQFNEAATGQREALLGMQDAETAGEREEYERLYNSYGNDISALENPEYRRWINQNPNNLSSNINNTNLSRRTRFGRGIKRAFRGYHQGMHQRYTARREQKGGMLRRGVRIAGGIAGGATLAVAGGIMGITSGDLNKVGQYMGAGTVGGYKVGSSIGNNVSDAAKVRGDMLKKAKEEYKKAYNGSEHSSKMRKKYEEEFKKNEENLKAIEDKLYVDRKQAEKIMEEHAPSYLDNEITDMNEFIATYKLEKEIGRNKAIAAKHYNDRLGNEKIKNIDPEKKEKYSNMFKQEFMQRGKSETEADKTVKEVYDAVNRFQKFKK